MKLLQILGLVLAGCVPVAADAQAVAVKHVAAPGGAVRPGALFTTATVVGEPVVGRFAAGALSGTVGYLDEGDLQPTGVAAPSLPALTLAAVPNPNTGAFDLVVKTPQALRGCLSVTDAAGRLLQAQDVALHAGTNTIRYARMPAGTCFVTLASGADRQTVAVVVTGT